MGTGLNTSRLLWQTSLALSGLGQLSAAQTSDSRPLAPVAVEGMVSTRTGGVHVVGSFRVRDGIFAFGGVGYRLKAQQVGVSVDAGVGAETRHGRNLVTYVHGGARRQRESSAGSRDWRLRIVTEAGARVCGGRMCGSLGFPVVWVKPLVIDLAIGVAIGLR